MKQKLLIILTTLATVAIAVATVWLGWANALAMMLIIAGLALSVWMLWHCFKDLRQTWREVKEVKQVIVELKQKGVEE